MRRIWNGFVAITLAMFITNCSSSSESENGFIDEDRRLAMACSDSAERFYQRPEGLPAFDAFLRGDVVRCGPYGTFSLGELTATATTLGYTGDIMTSGVRAYRVAYRTERVKTTDGTTQDGIAAATVFLPDSPRVADGEMPLLVVAQRRIRGVRRPGHRAAAGTRRGQPHIRAPTPSAGATTSP